MNDNQELAFEQEETALEKPETALEKSGSESLKDFEQRIKAEIDKQRTMTLTLIQHSKPSHWEKFGDSYRLNRHGAEYLMSLAHLTLDLSMPELTELDNGHYLYITKATVIDAVGRHSEFIGAGDSYHGFLGTNNDATNDKGEIKKPVQKVKRQNIIALAQSNAISNATGRFFGIQNVPEDEFKQIYPKWERVTEAKFRA